jgi:hypothetical protein
MTRFRWAVALCAFFAAMLVCASAAAQDARTSTAQKAAREWLALVDRNDAQASWNAMAKMFRDSISLDDWAKSLRQVRVPLGALKERTMLSTQFSNKMPKAPDGDYSLVIFRTAFVNKVDARETVTLSHESDGVWRIVGYMTR